ncbi:uncharacterized protein BP5553_03947 [Venustampulla echinocandica]|uniref:YTH domain-containing protein n=1 Tax=Venustampulla echinocandica TaxID=2656787 RepID=A0A370TVQ3_9HELO|nr:uncharacterized protein BP5553_03947 [Venustampulla echinocandica]RDL39607.1 hypothetical protein BP5553_03947 [Venustampulla echinocandica]
MWHNNGYGNNPPLQSNFNQNSYPSSPFGGSSASHPQQLFQHQPDMMQFEDSTAEGFMANDFQPEIGLYNEGALVQNQFNPHTQFSPPQINIPQAINANAPRPNPQINARAAELKAQLLKGREARSSSFTPPVGAKKTVAPGQGMSREPPSLSHASPKPPVTAAENREQALNINELISQYADTEKVPSASVKQKENLNTEPPVFSPHPLSAQHPTLSAKSQPLSLGSPTKVSKQVANGKMDGITTTVKESDKRRTSNASSADMSEGEILEEEAPEKQTPPTQPKEHQSPSKMLNKDEQLSRSLRDQISRPYGYGLRDESPAYRGPPANPKAQPQRNHGDGREEPQSRPDRKPYPSDSRAEPKPYIEMDMMPYRPRGPRDEEHGNPQSKRASKREGPEPISRERTHTTLADILPQDDDLKEWLEITGYHNIPYRDKVLSRRRALANLDAQRKMILADIEAEERGGLPPTSAIQTPAAMLPPPIPEKSRNSAEPMSMSMLTVPDVQPRRVFSNKRAYSNIEDTEDGGLAKVARIDDRVQEPRVKEEESEHYRPRSSGFSSSRRSSTDLRNERDSSRPGYDIDSSTYGRGRSRERDDSAGRRVYERRSSQHRPYGSDDPRDRDEHRGRRPFVEVGRYKGRAFDPNYRGRAGRGRGRGSPGHFEAKYDLGFGSRIANGKPYKDPKGYNGGVEGDTRYFIVKSFNEENVLNCIEDSAWTTQIQNGAIFKEAFESCKNVILVFSINKSKAFQGYARMESLPGSVEVPEWQTAINWESAGAFRVKWLVVCPTRFSRVGHLTNPYNDNHPVLIGKDGQEIEEKCGAALIELIDEEYRETADFWRDSEDGVNWEYY